MTRPRFATICTALLMLFALPLAAEDGAALFKTKCAACHGQDGAASTPMAKKLGIRSFHLPEVQKQTDAVLTGIIKNGKNKMPAYNGKLTDAEISAVVAHIRTFAK